MSEANGHSVSQTAPGRGRGWPARAAVSWAARDSELNFGYRMEPHGSSTSCSLPCRHALRPGSDNSIFASRLNSSPHLLQVPM
eukprot:6189802-Pleurochrysis_carterae.AAC.1